MERDPFEPAEGGSDYGRDLARDLADEPPSSIRDAAPDYLAPIDASAPVSGHVPPPESSGSPADTPEHDWSLARALIYPAFRPLGTQGEPITTLDLDPNRGGGHAHSQPLLDEGPAGIPVVYGLNAGAFDVIVNGDHLRTWGITAGDLQEAALANLAAWSKDAPWTDEISGERRLVSSDSGDGWDAVRILLPEVLDHLARELGPHGRVLVGIPERHLLVAGSLRPNDDEFATLFGDFVVETSGGADEPVDRRVFEIVDGRLVEFAGLAAA
jgi:hypothetical protein